MTYERSAANIIAINGVFNTNWLPLEKLAVAPAKPNQFLSPVVRLGESGKRVSKF